MLWPLPCISRLCADVTKRVLICGEGQLGDARLDHRGNSPAFRITHNCIIANLDIDLTGFCEAVLINGPPSLRPIIHGCSIKCAEHYLYVL